MRVEVANLWERTREIIAPGGVRPSTTKLFLPQNLPLSGY